MPIYLVERRVPGATLSSVAAMQQAAGVVCQARAAQGQPVRYLRSIYTPGESCCRCLFEAPTADLVQEVNEAAQLPYSRIILAMELALDATTGSPPELRSIDHATLRAETPSSADTPAPSTGEGGALGGG